MIDVADFDGVGELFADGALLDPDGREIARGRDAVASFYRRTVILYEGSPRTDHVTADAVIEIDEENATVTSTYVVHQEVDGRRVRVAAGRYADRFRCTDGQWRFAQRQFFLDDSHEMSNHVRMPQSPVMTITTDVRSEVRSWLDANWDPERPLAEWREILMDSGWGCPTWPEQWHGRGLDRETGSLVGEEFHRVGAVGPAIGVGMGLAAPTILDHGSDDLKARFLHAAATGEHKWCQLFSEPGSGSDLAGLSAHAERAGDEWIVNGQKVWNTGARTADYGLLMARTDQDVPKHRGITYFVLPMKQEGVEVRPIVQMNGYQSFNEVFISDARVPASNIVGDINDGWRVGLTTLAYERVGIGTIFSAPSSANAKGRTATEAAEEASAYLQTYVWYPSRMGRVDLLIPHAQAAGRSDDPRIRQRIAYVQTLARLDQLTKDRARAARAAGRAPGPEGSIAKLVLSHIARAAAGTHSAIAGPTGLLPGEDGALGGTAAEITLSYPAQSIAGGTDEIQLNILAERVLGLPKEPQLDTEVPFREVQRSSGRA